MGNRQHHEPYFLDDYALRKVSKVRDLGVIIVSNLKIRNQLNKGIEESNKVLFMIC